MVADPAGRRSEPGGATSGSTTTFGARPRADPHRELPLQGRAGAREVGVAGDWNGWSPRHTPMQQKDGAWQASVDLEPGRHPYKFVADGEWLVDPANPVTVQDGPHTNSLVTVAGAGCDGQQTEQKAHRTKR